MGTLETALLALGLGADCFSVCLGLGMDRGAGSRTIEMSALLAVAQSLLFALGYEVAALLHGLLHIRGAFEGKLSAWLRSVEPAMFHEWAHLLLSAGGALALAVVGLHMIAAARAPGVRLRVVKGRAGLFFVAAMVNLDSLAAGLGAGMMNVASLPAALAWMAAAGGTMAWLGLAAGRRIGIKAGRFAQPVGGAILVAVAARVLLGGLG